MKIRPVLIVKMFFFNPAERAVQETFLQLGDAPTVVINTLILAPA